MSQYNYQKAKFGEELSRDATTFTGSYQAFTATFTDTPVKVVIQNDTTVTVTISDDGTTNGLSLPTGVRIILDMNSSKTPSDWWSWRKGQQLYAKGAAGTGTIHIAYLYAV